MELGEKPKAFLVRLFSLYKQSLFFHVLLVPKFSDCLGTHTATKLSFEKSIKWVAHQFE